MQTQNASQQAQVPLAPKQGKKFLKTNVRDVISIEREHVISIIKLRLIKQLADMIEHEDDKIDFLTLCKRIDATIRSWYHFQFEELLQLYVFFDPVTGAQKLEQQNLPPDRVDVLEQRFLRNLFMMMEKSNFKLLSNEEVAVAEKGRYLLNLTISVDETRLDRKLLTTFFKTNPKANLPSFANQYLIFRRGIGVDQTSGLFMMEKIDTLLARFWQWLLMKLRLRPPPEQEVVADKKEDRPTEDDLIQTSISETQALCVERIRIENMDVSLKNLVTSTTIQEPTFERIILVYRPATPPNCPHALGERSIHIKHFRNIPMADMELVLPEKRNPALQVSDMLKIGISALIGLVALFGKIDAESIDKSVAFAILVAVFSYMFKVYYSYSTAKAKYQNLIVRSMFDKQLDTGRGSLLHLCDDVVQQEVKETILAYFILMSQGKLTVQELDSECEALLEEEFGERVDFEVSDAIVKLNKLNIVTKDSLGRYSHQSLRRACDIIGMTTDELVENTIDLG